MTDFAISTAREQLADLVNRAAYAKERVGLTRHGRRVAAIVSIEDLALLERIEDKLDLDAARVALAENEDEPEGWEDVRTALGL